MTRPKVSVVVVSRDRPDALTWCLTGLSQLQYSSFEIVVVADPPGHAAILDSPFADQVKLVEFDRANISEARNLGISHAAGDIVAFIDDDAVPEPSWLHNLVAPASRPDVAAMGGFVRGRNGISWQWQARTVDEAGSTEDLEVSPYRATVLTPKGRRAIKTEGTNMAVRRDVLVALEGFDPGFAFYLDETDLNLRLKRAGHATALSPLAEVHHGFAASPRRRRDRVPRDLFDIGSSWAVLQRKYLEEAQRRDHWRHLREHERKRVLEHMVAGRLLPRDVRHLMARLDQGYIQGLMRQRGGAQVLNSPISAFKPFPSRKRTSTVLAGRIWQRTRLRAEAAERAQSGDIVTLFLFSPTARYHYVRFDPAGYWEQRGGLFGRSVREASLFRMFTFSERVAAETRRIGKQRLIH
ncbi:glycosyltransferase family 2 protein [Tateyamaria omphalii]|uniref:Glycosyl transferase family 2 n=1 Tax=Tateyamaria omphalii TaxID=299262 RepID=A0A1P8MYK1_9RHOB|nr:glycosyltransferase [Tateyamaria omphalii]APX13167.1 glycosyl transferase family 2 [Tateyamaria omphalii]